MPGLNATISVTAGPLGCVLNGWYDFNANDDFGDAGERIFADEPIGPGAHVS